MDSNDLFEETWASWVVKHGSEQDLARLERYLRRERARRRRKELGDALLLASLGLMPRRTVNRIEP